MCYTKRRDLYTYFQHKGSWSGKRRKWTNLVIQESWPSKTTAEKLKPQCTRLLMQRVIDAKYLVTMNSVSHCGCTLVKLLANWTLHGICVDNPHVEVCLYMLWLSVCLLVISLRHNRENDIMASCYFTDGVNIVLHTQQHNSPFTMLR